MADKLISQLGATAGVVSTDVFEIEKLAGPPSEKATIAQLITLLDTIYAPTTGGLYVLKSGDTMTGLLTIAQATANTMAFAISGYSITGANAQPMIDLAGTFNTSGAPTGLKLNIVNTASDMTSLLFDFQASSVSRLKLQASGFLTGISAIFGYYQATSGGIPKLELYAPGPAFYISSDATVIWSSTTNSSGAADLGMARSAAGTLQITNGTVGTLRHLHVANITQGLAALLSITSGANQRAGNLTLIGGALTVANTSVTANSVILLTRKATGGTIGFAVTYTVIAATSFTVTSDNVLDTSTYSYFIIEVP